jgi:hypothetical protein
MTHGPAISARGAPPPIATAPAMTRAVPDIRRCRPRPVAPRPTVPCADGLRR